MAWYDDERKESHTQRYANAEVAAQDAHKAEAKGWEVQSRTSVSSYPVSRRVWQADFDTFNYQRDEVELTFIRTEAWLEQHRKV